MAQAARDRITRGYAALATLERTCHQAHFHEPCTKGWLFDTLVTPAMMYAAAIWASDLSASLWTQIERPLIIMISRLLHSKPSVPHDIIKAKLATPPAMLVFRARIHRASIIYAGVHAHRLRASIFQLRVSSHQLEIESGRARGIPREERTCRIRLTEVESEEHFVTRCPAYTELRERYGIGDSLQQHMIGLEQRRFGQFLVAASEVREQLL
ncbi:hypothetical protein L7F22_024560 [Adiantum nelumboides]|nr:hypothetical protein [Adiantum nelumboides]